MKTSINDLAFFGGTPLFNEQIHVGRPNIGNRDELFLKLNDIMDRHWLSNNGIYLQQLEQKIAELLDVRNCVAVANATLGLQLVFHALGLTGEVIVPSFTFIATAHALEWEGVRPVFCDIDAQTHNIDPQKVEALITEQTSAIVGVHLWGQSCQVEALEGIATQHNLRLIFDAAHAFMCSNDKRMIGNFGNAEVLSFHATKFFNTLEGGAIVTNDDELAQRLRYLRNFGFEGGVDFARGIGLNAKMNEFSAAVGLTNLESIPHVLECNLAHYHQYHSALADVAGVKLLSYPEDKINNYQYIVGEIDAEVFGVKRDDLLAILQAENIIARRYFFPGCHNIEPYRSQNPDAGKHLPVTQWANESVIVLPTGPSLTSANIETITDLIRFIAQNVSAIESQFEAGITQ